MKEETARALTLAACALQAYALAKSFKREVIDTYRNPLTLHSFYRLCGEPNSATETRTNLPHHPFPD